MSVIALIALQRPVVRETLAATVPPTPFRMSTNDQRFVSIEAT
jgi:hypothetical protein